MMRRPLLRIARWLTMLGLLFLLVPVPVVLILRLAEPPTTMVMVLRTLERVFKGERPFYPRRQPVPIERISPRLRRAVLTAEDERFFRHSGFDFQEIARARRL